jgi:hypothetical protein
MSNAQLIPMIAPDGTVGEIPSDKVTEALAKQFRLGVKLQAPSGEIGIIPRDKLVQAVQTPGMHVLQDSAMYATRTDDPRAPAPGQPGSKEDPYGFKDIGDTATNLVKGAAKNAYQISAPGVAASLATKNHPEVAAKLPEALQPTPAKDLQDQIMVNALPMMVGAEELPRTSTAPKAAAVAETAAKKAPPSVAEGIAYRLAKRVPYLGKAIKFGELVSAIADEIKGKQEAPPAAAPPPAPAPQMHGPTNPELWGKDVRTPDLPPAVDVIAANPGELARQQAIGKRSTVTHVLPSQNRGLALPGETAAAPPQGGLRPEMAQSRREFIQQKQDAGKLVSPDEKNFADAYDKRSTPATTSTVPRTPAGESVLNQVLTSLDNQWLMKIARSRGINISQEVQLKPGVANTRLIGKIMADFTPDELENARNTGIEVSRFKRAPQDFADEDLAREAWHVKVLQTYFPDVKIPAAALKRVAATVEAPKPAKAAVKAPEETPEISDEALSDLMKQSIEQIKKRKAAQ